MKKIRILIADNYRLNRDSWTYILNSDSRFEVIAACADADKAVDLATEKKPDIILMNINVPVFAGMEATQKIRKKITRHTCDWYLCKYTTCVRKKNDADGC